LVGLFSDRGLVELSLSTGERAQLTGGDKLGLMPVLTVSGNETFALMTADGSAFLQRSGAASPPNGTPRATKAEVAGDAHLLSSDDGTLVSLTSNTALRLQRDGEIQELPEIRCAHPVSLVPAGPARVVAACSSGQLWLIGPSTNVPTSDSPRL
jgi:hypothetical protein